MHGICSLVLAFKALSSVSDELSLLIGAGVSSFGFLRDCKSGAGGGKIPNPNCSQEVPLIQFVVVYRAGTRKLGAPQPELLGGSSSLVQFVHGASQTDASRRITQDDDDNN